MTDDGSAPTIPDSAAPTHTPRQSGTGPGVRAPEDRYKLRTVLGSGGMGEVWLAHDLRIDREIAIKMMRGEPHPDSVARFLREARVQGRLEHPSVVPVHDLGPPDQAPFFAMKRLTGTTLHDVIKGASAEWTRRKLLTRFVEVCLAVEFAHQRGVIHRDLKPANIMLGDFGETYVLDWGLARIAEDREEKRSPISAIQTADLRSDSGSGGHTEAGALLGTPGYMAPEQMRGEVADSRADVFALGCILFEILAREPAISRDKPFEATLAGGPYHPAHGRASLDIAPELDGITARATDPDRDKRLASARELADRVQAFLDGDRDLERRRQLSAEHTANAKAAVERSGDAARAEAMREGGRAIALDPENVTAQKILMKLMLEVPDPLPPAAQARIDADNNEATRAVLRLGMRGYLANAALLPLVKLLGVEGWWPFLVLGVFVLLQAAVCGLASHRAKPITPAVWATLVINQIVMLSLVGVFFGVLILVPIFVFGSLPVMLMTPQINKPLIAFVTHALCIAIPLSLELAHVIPHSFHIVGDTLVIQPWAVRVPPLTYLIVMFAQIGVQLWVMTRVLGGQRQIQDKSQKFIHAQTWQLEQMVQGE